MNAAKTSELIGIHINTVKYRLRKINAHFLLARSAGGQGRFVLRIDDTDAERSRREFAVDRKSVV